MPAGSSYSRVVVNADGVAVATVSNDFSDRLQRVHTVTVQLSEGEGEARIYSQFVSDESFIAGTYSGDRDTNELAHPVALGPGDKLLVRWTGATPGATATMGTRYDEREV